MTKHTCSLIFTILTSLLNIVLTLAILLLFVGGLLFAVFKATGKIPANSYIVQAGIPVMLILGLILSLKLFTNITGEIIEIFHLEDKLEDKIVIRYSKENRL